MNLVCSIQSVLFIALATAGCRQTFLLPDARSSNVQETLLSNDPSFLLWLLSMPMQEAEANIAYNFVNSLLTMTLNGKFALETTLICAFQNNTP
jgi:hypothetical protein